MLGYLTKSNKLLKFEDIQKSNYNNKEGVGLNSLVFIKLTKIIKWHYTTYGKLKHLFFYCPCP